MNLAVGFSCSKAFGNPIADFLLLHHVEVDALLQYAQGQLPFNCLFFERGDPVLPQLRQTLNRPQPAFTKSVDCFLRLEYVVAFFFALRLYRRQIFTFTKASFDSRSQAMQDALKTVVFGVFHK